MKKYAYSCNNTIRCVLFQYNKLIDKKNINLRLAEQAIERDGWKGIEDVLKMLPGEHFGNPCIKSAKGGGNLQSATKPKTVVVYFIGGITFTEIAALRFVAKQKKCRIIIATTNMINSKKLLENCVNWFTKTQFLR